MDREPEIAVLGVASQMPKAYMPRSSSSIAGPFSAYRCNSTSVSLFDLNLTPRASSRLANRLIVVNLSIEGNLQ